MPKNKSNTVIVSMFDVNILLWLKSHKAAVWLYNFSVVEFLFSETTD